MAKRLVDYEPEELLMELIRRHPPGQGPNKIVWSTPPLAVLVPIGKNHTAYMYLYSDAVDALKELLRDD